MKEITTARSLPDPILTFSMEITNAIMALTPAIGPSSIPTASASAKPASPVEMQPVLEAYLSLADALASDDAAGAEKAVGLLEADLARVQAAALTGEARHRFTELIGRLRQAVPVEAPKDIAAQRRLLGTIAPIMREYLSSFGHTLSFSIFEMFCPMAFEAMGAIWHQKGRDIRNPYFGAQMPLCGEVRSEPPPAQSRGGR